MKYSILFLLLLIGTVSCDSTAITDTNAVIETDTIPTIEIDSLDFLSNQIKNNSQNADFWASRAKYFIKKGNITDALLDMKSAVRLDTNNTTYRNYYGDLLITTLDLDKAMSNFEYILSIDSSNAKAYVGIGHIYALVDNPGLATGFLNKAYQIDPYLSEAYFLEGLIYRSDFYETGRDESWDRAISSFQTAVEQNPNYYSAYIEMGVMHDEQDHDIALEYYNTAIAISPNSTEAWYNKGMFFQNREKYTEAKTCYRSIISIDSLYTKSYYNQGYIHLVYEKQLDSAIYFFNQTIHYDSLHYYAYNNLGLSHERNGDLDLAKEAYRKAIDINPDFKLAKKNLHLLE
jgi:tetratricopeptide (TPR) repeat protein